MNKIIRKISRTYKGLSLIKEQVEFSVKENKALLSELMTRKASVSSTLQPTRVDSAGAPEISVVVPVLNTAPYLRKCLDSLRDQTLTNIEIICVDDGSTDDSRVILKEYADLDERFIVLTQDHLGVSAARNAALQRARAPYMMSCDSDDWFDPDMCRIMLETLKREDVDVVTCGMNVIYDVPEELRENVTEYLRLKSFGKQDITQDMVLVMDVSLCNKIYKRSIIEEHGIDFPQGLHFEDAYFNDAYMAASETIYFLHLPLYNYLRHGTSVMSTSYKKSGTSSDYLHIAFKTWDYFEKEGLLDTHCEYYWRRFLQYSTFAFKHLEGQEQAEAKRLAREFVNKHKASLAKATFKTRNSVKILLYGRFKVLHKIYRFPKWLYAKLSSSQGIRLEIVELMEQSMGIQAQIQALLIKEYALCGESDTLSDSREATEGSSESRVVP